MLLHYGGEPVHICDGLRCESCRKCYMCCQGHEAQPDDAAEDAEEAAPRNPLIDDDGWPTAAAGPDA